MLRVIFPAEHSLAERRVGDDPDMVFQAEWPPVGVDAAVRQTVRKLVGHNVPISQGTVQKLVGKVTDAKPTDFALLAERLDRIHRFFDWCLRVGPMREIQVDVIGLETLEAEVTAGQNVL